jgi:integrase
MPLDKIGTSTIAAFRAALLKKELKAKTINNILAVVSTVLRYAVDAEILAWSPKIGLLRYERPEIEFWEFDEYARIVVAAEGVSPTCAAAVLLAGEAGLRVGEVMGLRWSDVDFIGGTITVAQKIRRGEV